MKYKAGGIAVTETPKLPALWTEYSDYVSTFETRDGKKGMTFYSLTVGWDVWIEE
jgi:hypothetical protein